MEDLENNIAANNTLTNEMTLLIALSKYLIDKKYKSEVNNAFHLEIDQAKFIRFFREHKLTGIIAAVIKDFHEHIPADWLKQLNLIFEKHQKRMLKLTGQMLLIDRAFKQQGIESAWLKGPLLAQQLWNSPFIRSSVDIDILIDIKQLSEADIILSGLGFKPENNWKDFGPGFFNKWQGLTHHVLYRNINNRAAIEVHWRLTTPQAMFDIPTEKLLSEAIQVKLFDHNFNVISGTYNPAYLLLHGASHSWECLSWLLDIAMLIRKEPGTEEKLRGFIADNNYSLSLLEGINAAKYLFLDEKIRLSKNEQAILENANNLELKLNAFKIASTIAGFKKGLDYKFECFKKSYLFLSDVEQHQLPHQLFFLYYFLAPLLWVKRTLKPKKAV